MENLKGNFSKKLLHKRGGKSEGECFLKVDCIRGVENLKGDVSKKVTVLEGWKI